MTLLTLFLLRLSSGLSLGVALASPRQTPSGFFRNQLYVILGICALAALLSRLCAPAAFPWALAAAVLSYFGAVAWLYESSRWGLIFLALVGAIALGGSLEASGENLQRAALAPPEGTEAKIGTETTIAARRLRLLQGVASPALLGLTLAAMLLGHWHLNAPGMALQPLQRLTLLLYAAVASQVAICGLGLVLEAAHGSAASTLQEWLFLVLRWAFGLVGVVALVWMARQTLRIPNTQSATGILYVAVIGAFGGEIVSMLLSAQSCYPL